jgi:O-antigen/teichoic acid export membrane protein
MPSGEFGSYSFTMSFLAFVGVFFEFGIFLPAARLAAQSPREEGRRLFGATMIFFVPVGACFLILVYSASFFIDAWFHVSSGPALRLMAPLGVVFPLQFVLYQMAQGLDRLHVFSFSSALSSMLFALGIAAATALNRRISLLLALVISLGTSVIAYAILIGWLRPIFRGGARYFKTLKAGAQEYGTSVYIGRVLSTGTYKLDVLMVAAVAGANQVAFYALATSVAIAVGFVGTGISGALFPGMTRNDRIDRRWLATAWGTGVAGATIATIFARPVVKLAFSARYLPVARLIPPLAFAEALRGVTWIYISFQSAHGRGRDLRTAALWLTGSNVLFNLALIPPFGAGGAAWASLFALIANLWVHRRFYNRSHEGPADAFESESGEQSA